VDDCRAKIELAQQVVGMAFEDGAAFQSGQEGGGVFDAVAAGLATPDRG
jgi:hypothetical protein